VSSIVLLQQQAEQLRNEAALMRQELQSQLAAQLAKETAKIDGWIQDLLFLPTRSRSNNSNGTTTTTTTTTTTMMDVEILNDIDQVVQVLQDKRYSQEQIHKIFDRLCVTGPASMSRTNCSPLMTLFVDAVGIMDTIERQDNPNKRWNTGKVERVLRKRLFLLDFGMIPEEDELSRDVSSSQHNKNKNPWKL
jgi:hypothetical protein